jgi:succinate-semialdehyde dehydrogenase/glutarate-semialdehyde dehydrogenase
MTDTFSSTASEQRVVDAVPKRLYIGGEWCGAADGGTIPVVDPATEEVLCEVADGNADDMMAALDAAVDAQAEWTRSTPNDRSEILWRGFESLHEHSDDLALLMTLEMGKPLAESKAEIAYAAEYFRWYSGEALRLDGSYKSAGNNLSRALVMKRPVGPCLMITPWNFPMAMGTRKIGPAIAAGCTMVVKPATNTPLSMLALTQILVDLGLPAGVLNVVTTRSANATTAPLIADPRLRKLSFTGSTDVGVKLLEAAAKNVLRTSMELGGNAPFIVFEDADLDAAVEGALLAKLRNMGEACTAANRFYVADEVAEEFATRLAERMGALRLGRGTDERSQVGPLIDGPSRDAVAALVQDAIDGGAYPLAGGDVPDGRGYFYPPTVLRDVAANARILNEEIFGPVAPIVSFTTEDEAIARANDTRYGLVAYVFTRDVQRAIRVCEALDTGMVGLNQGMVSNAGAPFGGVKASGLGREGGNEGIAEYLECKYVAVSV